MHYIFLFLIKKSHNSKNLQRLKKHTVNRYIFNSIFVRFSLFNPTYICMQAENLPNDKKNRANCLNGIYIKYAIFKRKIQKPQPQTEPFCAQKHLFSFTFSIITINLTRVCICVCVCFFYVRSNWGGPGP